MQALFPRPVLRRHAHFLKLCASFYYKAHCLPTLLTGTTGFSHLQTILYLLLINLGLLFMCRI